MENSRNDIFQEELLEIFNSVSRDRQRYMLMMMAIMAESWNDEGKYEETEF